MEKYPLRVKDGLEFQIKSYVKKFWQRYDKATNKFVKQDNYAEGMTAKYLFDLQDGNQIELSKDNLQQCLLGAFEYKKTLKDLVFTVKTNGKTGMEIRYFINVKRQDNKPIQPANQQPAVKAPDKEQVMIENIPF